MKSNQVTVATRLKDFGESYRALFTIADYEYPDHPGAGNIIWEGRLMLTDFALALNEIYEATKSAASTVNDLTMKAAKELRITDNMNETKLLTESIQKSLKYALDQLESEGDKQMCLLKRKTAQYRDNVVLPEISALKATVQRLEEEKDKPKGSLLPRLAVSFSLRKDRKTSSDRIAVLDLARSDLSVATEICVKVGQMRTNVSTCTRNWQVLHRELERNHYTKIAGLLSRPSIDQQTREKIRMEFGNLHNILLISIDEIHVVYRDIDSHFGAGRNINQRVDAFRKAVANTSHTLKQLSDVHGIVKMRDEKAHPREVHNLAQCTLEHLHRAERVLKEWAVYVTDDSTGPLTFIDDARRLCTHTAESFERNWGPSFVRLSANLGTGKPRALKTGNSRDIVRAEKLLTPSSEAQRTLKELKGIFIAITAFSTRLPMDLLAYDRRPQGTPQVQSELSTNPFVVAKEIAAKAHEVVEDEIGRLEKFVGSQHPS